MQPVINTKKLELVNSIPHLYVTEKVASLLRTVLWVFKLIFFACLSPVIANQKRDFSMFFLNSDLWPHKGNIFCYLLFSNIGIK